MKDASNVNKVIASAELLNATGSKQAKGLDGEMNSSWSTPLAPSGESWSNDSTEERPRQFAPLPRKLRTPAISISAPTPAPNSIPGPETSIPDLLPNSPPPANSNAARRIAKLPRRTKRELLNANGAFYRPLEVTLAPTNCGCPGSECLKALVSVATEAHTFKPTTSSELANWNGEASVSISSHRQDSELAADSIAELAPSLVNMHANENPQPIMSLPQGSDTTSASLADVLSSNFDFNTASSSASSYWNGLCSRVNITQYKINGGLSDTQLLPSYGMFSTSSKQSTTRFPESHFLSSLVPTRQPLISFQPTFAGPEPQALVETFALQTGHWAKASDTYRCPVIQTDDWELKVDKAAASLSHLHPGLPMDDSTNKAIWGELNIDDNVEDSVGAREDDLAEGLLDVHTSEVLTIVRQD